MQPLGSWHTEGHLNLLNVRITFLCERFELLLRAGVFLRDLMRTAEALVIHVAPLEELVHIAANGDEPTNPAQGPYHDGYNDDLVVAGSICSGKPGQ